MPWWHVGCLHPWDLGATREVWKSNRRCGRENATYAYDLKARHSGNLFPHLCRPSNVSIASWSFFHLPFFFFSPFLRDISSSHANINKAFLPQRASSKARQSLRPSRAHTHKPIERRWKHFCQYCTRTDNPPHPPLPALGPSAESDSGSPEREQKPQLLSTAQGRAFA